MGVNHVVAQFPRAISTILVSSLASIAFHYRSRSFLICPCLMEGK